ncbi:phage/plasmid primase, P4 family [Deinococcus sp. Leaf326]|uniref:phage/plasmid primase, P4 family n=1 Tax=Deinococcus sp. Leaf326 TaxID=1736338 RepID=UPI0009ECAC2E|nr:phage/plasmid primase, P4 family [Deinococcus sp. Leaf326]
MITTEQAQDAIERGWSIIALNGNKRPLSKWAERQRSAFTLEEIKTELPKAAALGVVTGQLSGLIVLDTDDKQADDFLRGLGLEPHVKTPSGGNHYYFRHPGIGQSYKTFNPQSDGNDAKSYKEQYGLLDCRADGGYAAFVGEVDTGSYQQLRDPTDLYELDLLPEKFVGILQHGYKGLANERATTTSTVAIKGASVDRLLAEASTRLSSGRDNSCFWLAQQLRDNRHSKEDALSVMERFHRLLPDTDTKGQRDEFTLGTALGKVEVAYETPAREPWGGPMFATTDIGNGERLAHEAADTLRHNDTQGWLVWDGRRWRGSGDSGPMMEAKRVAKKMTQEALDYGQQAKTIEDEGRRNFATTEAKALVQHAQRSQSLPRLKAMLECAKTEQSIAVRAEEFDNSPYLLNVKNGTIDLQSGKLHPHRREDMLTRVVNIDYVPDAQCPNWTDFLRTVTGNNPDLIRYLKRVAGYILTGSSQEHAIFVLHGEGQNGKSTFVNALELIAGEYASAIDSRTLLSKNNLGGGINNDLARLQGVRLAHASEPDMGAMLDEALMKKLSSGERVTARFLHKEFFEFVPEFKLVLSANHLPTTRGNDRGIWRRLKLVPFDQTIPDSNKERDFFDKRLKPEIEGILAWAVEGALEWNQDGLSEPQTIREATKHYRDEMDLIGQFIEDRCIIDAAAREEVGTLYSFYRSWAEQNGCTPVKQQALSRDFTRRGYEEQKSNGKRYRVGLRLRMVSDASWGVVDLTE